MNLLEIHQQIIACNRCPRLRAYCAQVAREKKAAHRNETYWGRPVPGFGDPKARVLVLALAPAAHGANRTGRVFTGDVAGGSGDFLMSAMHKAGFASIPTSRHAADGLQLHDAYIAAAVRCAPPDNKPLPQELASCFEFAAREAALLPRPRVFVALGGLAFRTCLALLAAEGATLPRPRPRFAHGAIVRIGADTVLATYHPSQQNTFTGRLTPPMLSSVFRRAVREAQKASSRAAPRSATS